MAQAKEMTSGASFPLILNFRILHRLLQRLLYSRSPEIRSARLRHHASLHIRQPQDIRSHVGCLSHNHQFAMRLHLANNANSGKYLRRSIYLSSYNVYRHTFYLLLQLIVRYHSCLGRQQDTILVPATFVGAEYHTRPFLHYRVRVGSSRSRHRHGIFARRFVGAVLYLYES